MKKHVLLFTLLFLFGFTQVGWGQILTFEFNALSGDEASATSNSNNSNLTSSTITRGSGVTAASNAQRFNSANWSMSALDANDYVEFAITPNSGKKFSITSIVMLHQRSSNGPTGFAIRSSVNSYASDLATATGNGTATLTATFTFAQSDITTATTYRIYAYTSAAANGTWGPGDGTGNDITVNGSTADAPLPVELTSFSALTKNKTVNLVWQTATEVNNYGFEIQRLQDYKITRLQDYKITRLQDSNWEKVGFVNGAGNSNSPKEYSFTDKSTTSGKYVYRLKQIDNDGQFKYSKEVEVDLANPTTFALAQNFPNPFNPTTSLQYAVSAKQFVTIKVFDMLGREVAVLVNAEKEPGTYIAEFATTGLASGTYIYRMQAGEFVQTKKMIILK